MLPTYPQYLHEIVDHNHVTSKLRLRHGASPVGNLTALARVQVARIRMMDFMVTNLKRNEIKNYISLKLVISKSQNFCSE